MSLTQRFSVIKDLSAICSFFVPVSTIYHPVFSNIPTIGSLEQAALYEEVISPQYFLNFDFDLIDADSNMEWPS